MKKFKKYAVFFSVGGMGYGIIELLWRGRTHWTMIIAGGICFIIFSLVAEKLKGQPLIYKAILCSVWVTAVELLFGTVFNILLEKHIWDYSNIPLNFLGQVCFLYTLLWGILALFLLPVAEQLNKKL